MLNQFFENPRYIVYAILVHIAFVAIIVVSLDWRSKPHPMQHPENVVQAVTVDEGKVQAELNKMQAAEKRKQQEDEAKRQDQEKKVQEAKQAREQEEKRLVEVQKQREAEQLKLKEQQAKLEDEAKKAQELEQNQKVEAERLEALKKEQEALDMKRKQEEQRLADEKRKQDEQRALQEQMAAEQQQLEVERQKKVQSVVDKYIAIIQQQVARNWFKPAGAKQGLSCTVKVRLIPGGEVLDARIVSSSGDPVFDRSVETAVLKASPLPLPPDPSLFENFRDLTFLFKPEE